MITISKANIEYINAQINEPLFSSDVRYYAPEYEANPQDMIEDYIKTVYSEAILSVSIAFEYVYNSLDELEYIMPYSAEVITEDDYKGYRRYVDIDITPLSEKVIVTSNFKIEKYNSSKVELPFDFDFEEAMEYVARYPNVLQN